MPKNTQPVFSDDKHRNRADCSGGASERGAVLVEFALAFPALLGITIMCIHLCMYWDAVCLANYAAFSIGRSAKASSGGGRSPTSATPESGFPSANTLSTTAAAALLMTPALRSGPLPGEEWLAQLSGAVPSGIPAGLPAKQTQRFLQSLQRTVLFDAVGIRTVAANAYGIRDHSLRGFRGQQTALIESRIDFPMKWNAAAGLLFSRDNNRIPGPSRLLDRHWIRARGHSVQLAEPSNVIRPDDFVKNE